MKLKQVDRSLLVELKDTLPPEAEEAVEKESAIVAAPPPALPTPLPMPVPPNGQSTEPMSVTVPASPSPAGPTAMQAEEVVRAMQEAFQNSKVIPHWPMYLRNVKQFIKNSSPTFDEHRFGFHSFLEVIRSGQRAGLFRLERNRQGILRVFPGNLISQLQRSSGQRSDEAPVSPVKPYDVEDDITLQQPVSHSHPAFAGIPQETVSEAQPEGEQPVMESSSQVEEEKPARKRRVSSGIKRKTVAPRKTAGTAAKRPSPRKKTTPGEDRPE